MSTVGRKEGREPVKERSGSTYRVDEGIRTAVKERE